MLGRPHLAAALVKAGACRTVREAFARFLRRGKPGYVPRQVSTLDDAIRAFREAVRLDEDFEAHLDRFRHAVDLAVFFDTRLIRLFSYYPAEGQNIDGCGDEVIERFGRKMELIANVDVVLAHENEAGIYGHSA